MAVKKRVVEVKLSRSDYHKNRYLLGRWGMTLAEYKKLVVGQDSRCKCCGSKTKRFSVYYRRYEREVAALVCAQCSALVHMAESNPVLLVRVRAFINSNDGVQAD